MARKDLDLYNIGEEPADLKNAIVSLRDDFDSHNHNGVNSKSFQTLMTETIIGRVAIIGGYKLFGAVVGFDSSDYKTVAEALKAGETRIFVKNGTYSNEPVWDITNANVYILGESYGGVTITFAQNVSDSRSIYWNNTNVKIENLKLISYETGQQTLIVFGSSATYPIIINCIMRNKQGKYLDGNLNQATLRGTFKNIYFDCLATSDATLMKVFYYINYSNVIDCRIDMDFATSGFNPVESCTNTKFTGCDFTMDSDRSNEYVIYNSVVNFYNCYFYAYQIKADSNFYNCFFENNSKAPSGFFVSITTAAYQFNNNRIKTASTDNIFTVTAANVQVVGNFFDGGKAMVFEPTISSVLGIQFCNNTWVSSYDVAAMDLRLGSVGHTTDYANVIGNIIRNNSNSYTPTITDNSTGCVTTPNQLIKG